jgi:hypothetical protein
MMRQRPAIEPTRLQLQDAETGALILLDITAQPATHDQRWRVSGFTWRWQASRCPTMHHLRCIERCTSRRWVCSESTR